MRNGTYRMVVFGDSIAWGQGLLEQDKFHTIVAQGLPAAAGAPPIEKTVMAHSGAIIGAGVKTPANEKPLNGEVPTSYPTILDQVAAFADSPETVDLILIDGGINDMGVGDILDPLTDTSDLQGWIETYCHVDMITLLDQVTAKFTLPTARIVVTGYYQILSEQSDRNLYNLFFKVMGVPLLNDLGEDLEGLVLAKTVKNCALFADLSAIALQNAVHEANASPAGNNRIVFVNPGFGPKNAVFANPTWVFGVNDDLDLSPQDEVVAARHAACDLDEHDPLQLLTCYRASAGHPNALGAQQYAARILAALQTA